MVPQGLLHFWDSPCTHKVAKVLNIPYLLSVENFHEIEQGRGFGHSETLVGLSITAGKVKGCTGLTLILDSD